jgi:putative spermidine/putrescine transport system substrate-binding protein
MTTTYAYQDSRTRISRREFLRWGALGGLSLAGLGSIASLLAEEATTALASTSDAGRLSQLIAAAKKEGHLNVIALPPDWADYGEIMSTFKAKYGIPITDAAPNDSSAQENQAIISLKGQSRAPDVVDVAPSIAELGRKQGLYTPYKVSTWNTIPANMKDPHGYWVGDYWGVISFGSNLNVVKHPPKDWSDLLSPRYHGMVAIDGDPRTAGDAFGAVFAAALANGGSLNNIEPGIDFFAKLKKRGNFIPADALPANIAKGVTPIAIKWDYLNLASKKEFAGNPPFQVTIPKTGIYGSYYCQAISAYAPHPHAARLWEEFLYSDEGQLLFLKGYTHPARYHDLVKRHKVPHALAKQLPPASAYKHVKFATLEQIKAAAKVVQEQWGPKVAGSG